MKAALAAIDYAIELAEKADAAFHQATGKIDDLAHQGIARLKALREKVAEAAGVFGSEGGCYAALSPEAQAEVDATFAAMQE